MKRLMLFMECILNELGMRCRTSTALDCKTIKRRVDHEGISFLTISLSNFGKDFERSLDQGFVDPCQYMGFARTGGLPRLLSGFLDQVFDRSSGRLLDDPSIDCIQAIRQITLMWGKMKIDCTPERVAAAIDKYVECEKEVVAHVERLESDMHHLSSLTRVGTLLWGDILARVDEDIYYDRIIPGHGPGATADYLKGNLKWNQSEWTDRLEEVFPHWVYLSPSWLLSLDKLDHVTLLEPEAERPVRVITVPKTLKTPRIIAIEPTCMQYMQQGIARSLQEAVESDDTARQLIGWRYQEPNQQLARLGSQDGSLATLDMSEASDRVSNLHVRTMARYFPHFLAGVDACRSRKADVDGYGEIPLSKFASMGSALTFPLEAMVFCTVIFIGIESALSRPLTKKDVKSLLGKVRVYGDDIIVPVDYVPHVVEALETFGFKVNSSKSFWTGKFRESCGKEYYDGEDVSIIRVRTYLPTQRGDAPEIISTVATRNQLYKAGLWRSCSFLDGHLETLIPFPCVLEESPLLGRFSFLGYDLSESRLDPLLHTPLVKGAVAASRIPASVLDDYGALLKCLSADEMFIDERHLERQGRPSTVDIKLRWKQPF